MPAARAASIAVWFPFPEQSQLRSQNSPTLLPPHAQLPALQVPASRAAQMFVWLPTPLQPHSTSQNCPMKLPTQSHDSPPLAPRVPQLRSQNSPAWPVSQGRISALRLFLRVAFGR